MGIVAKKEDRELLDKVCELSIYLKEDPLITAINTGNSFYLVAEGWEKQNPKTPGEVHEFYRGAREYLWNLVISNYGIPHQIRIRQDVSSIVEPGQDVLDLGGGIGSTLLDLRTRVCSLTHADVGGVLFEYARWRYDRMNMNVAMTELPSDYLDGNDPLAGKSFDVIVCTEVIEHVVEPEKLVAYLAAHLKKGGTLVATVSFDDDHGLFPCHLNCDKWTNERFLAEVFPANGLRRLDQRDYVFKKE